MTSNYDQYIRPELWAVPIECIGYIFQGRELPDGLAEIRCSGAPPRSAAKAYILDAVPREHVGGAIAAIIAYRDTCSKLIG